MGVSGARRGQGRRMVLAAALTLTVAACSPIYRNHGYVPSDQELAEVTVGESTREDVALLLGRPSASGLLNDVGWFYVQSRWKQVGPREPKEIDRQVVSVTFAEDGTVENVERFGLEDGRVVVISRRVTESNIKGIGLIRQLLSSIGRLRASDIVE
jgi:outer membrane protein assembly factor BamE (lipoprotein component of BamABCDE complex)